MQVSVRAFPICQVYSVGAVSNGASSFMVPKQLEPVQMLQQVFFGESTCAVLASQPLQTGGACPASR